MKGLFIVTRTNEMHKHYESFTCLGNEVQLYTYDHRADLNKWAKGAALDAEVLAAVKEYSPDVIVYVGACKGNSPSPACFKSLRDFAPTVHFCSDAADEPWWEELITFDRVGSFNVQVALDGNKNWPLHNTQITALTPIDPACFPNPPTPHADRSVYFGFAGNVGSVSKLKDGRVVGRRPLVAAMMEFGLQVRQRDHESFKDTYPQAAKYMADCRITPNFPATGSYDRMHVKGRVVETGLAGAMLLEQAGSPTPDWFEKGVDYLEWATMAEAKAIVDKYIRLPEETQAFGERLRAKVMAKHSPEVFWGNIFQRCGL